jgi:hypothetical protein
MAFNAHITLINSNSTLARNFRVMATGYGPELQKTGTQRLTVTGKLDNQVSAIIRRWRYVLKVYHTDPVGGSWGTLGDLKTFFSYNDPGGNPSNVITLRDFDYPETSTEYSVYLVGRLSEKPKTQCIEGESAWFEVPIEMIQTEPS